MWEVEISVLPIQTIEFLSFSSPHSAPEKPSRQNSIFPQKSLAENVSTSSMEYPQLPLTICGPGPLKSGSPIEWPLQVSNKVRGTNLQNCTLVVHIMSKTSNSKFMSVEPPKAQWMDFLFSKPELRACKNDWIHYPGEKSPLFIQTTFTALAAAM